jgi:hypothetical protein
MFLMESKSKSNLEWIKSRMNQISNESNLEWIKSRMRNQISISTRHLSNAYDIYGEFHFRFRRVKFDLWMTLVANYKVSKIRGDTFGILGILFQDLGILFQDTISGYYLRILFQDTISGFCFRILSQDTISGFCFKIPSQDSISGFEYDSLICL